MENVELEKAITGILLFSGKACRITINCPYISIMSQGGQGMYSDIGPKKTEIRYGSLDYGEYTFKKQKPIMIWGQKNRGSGISFLP